MIKLSYFISFFYRQLIWNIKKTFKDFQTTFYYRIFINLQLIISLLMSFAILISYEFENNIKNSESKCSEGCIFSITYFSIHSKDIL